MMSWQSFIQSAHSRGGAPFLWDLPDFPDARYRSLSQGSAVTGTICWKLPADEQSLIVIRECAPEAPDGEKCYLAV